MTGLTTLSTIPLAGVPPALNDTLVAVNALNLDRRFTVSQLGGHILAASNLDFYVAPPPLGNDNNLGTSPTTPFATIQQAVTTAALFNYQNAFHPRVHVADGTYFLTAIIILPSLFNVDLTNFPSGGLIQGDPTTPGNCILDATNTIGHFVHPAAGTAWSITGFHMQNAPTGTAINVNNAAAILNADSLEFQNNLRHWKAFAGGQIFCGFDNFKLSFQGNANNLSLAQVASQIIDFGCVWTFVGSQTFSQGIFQASEASTIDANYFSVTNPGNVHGKRYVLGQYSTVQQLNAANRSLMIGDAVGNINGFSIIQNDPGPNIYTPTSGTTVTTTPGEHTSILNPAGTLATLTVDLPTQMDGGEAWSLSTTQAITALTLATTDGSVLHGAPTTLAAGQTIFMTNVGQTAWYPGGSPSQGTA